MVDIESDAHKKASTIADWVDEEVSDIRIHPSVRLEVGVHFVVNGLESTLRACLRSNLAALQLGQPGTLIDTPVLTIRMVPRGDMTHPPGTVGIGRMTVTDKPIQIGDTKATHTYVYVDVRRARAKVIKRLTAEARSQLPPNEPAILILDAKGDEVEQRCTQLTGLRPSPTRRVVLT